MRDITYILGHYGSPTKTAPLRQFLIEMTYPLRNRKIPPLEILNQILLRGIVPRVGEWEPFTITEQEYEELVQSLQSKESDRYLTLKPDPLVKTPEDWYSYLETLGY